MNCVNNLKTGHVLSGSSHACSAGEDVLIMDACPTTALGIERVLTENCGIAGSLNFVQDLAGISSRVASAPPSLLIMDICGEKELMLDGLRLLARLRETYPAMKIIICTEFSDYRVLALLVSSKVSGILLKNEPALALAQCVSIGIKGNQQWLSPKVKKLLTNTSSKNTALTARETGCSRLSFFWSKCLPSGADAASQYSYSKYS